MAKKVGDLVIHLTLPAVASLCNGLAGFLEQWAERERAAVERAVAAHGYEERLRQEAEFYAVPVESLRKWDEWGVPWRALVAAGQRPEMTGEQSAPPQIKPDPETMGKSWIW